MTTTTISVTAADVTHAACAAINVLERIDDTLVHAAHRALFSPDPWHAQWRDELALESLAAELEFGGLSREAKALRAAEATA